mgnify:CR=1 FL=1
MFSDNLVLKFFWEHAYGPPLPPPVEGSHLQRSVFHPEQHSQKKKKNNTRKIKKLSFI